MAIVVLVLVTSAGYSVKKQTDAYKTFTEEAPKPAPIADLSKHDAELNSLVSRLRHFDHEIENKQAAEISLTPLDINLAFAHYAVFENFRGQLSFDTFTDTHVSGVLHYPFRSTSELPSFIRSTLNIAARDNNLNGRFTATPLLTDGKLLLNMTEIQSNIGQVPEEWFAGISRFLISGELEQKLKDDPKNPPLLLSKLKKITSLTLKDGSLSLAYSPDHTPPSIKQESDAMATKAKQLVALGALIFILTMILLFIVLSRRQKARNKEAHSC